MLTVWYQTFISTYLVFLLYTGCLVTIRKKTEAEELYSLIGKRLRAKINPYKDGDEELHETVLANEHHATL